MPYLVFGDRTTIFSYPDACSVADRAMKKIEAKVM